MELKLDLDQSTPTIDTRYSSSGSFQSPQASSPSPEPRAILPALLFASVMDELNPSNKSPNRHLNLSHNPLTILIKCPRIDFQTPRILEEAESQNQSPAKFVE
jgi:hypothetical protein